MHLTTTDKIHFVIGVTVMLVCGTLLMYSKEIKSFVRPLYKNGEIIRACAMGEFFE